MIKQEKLSRRLYKIYYQFVKVKKQNGTQRSVEVVQWVGDGDQLRRELQQRISNQLEQISGAPIIVFQNFIDKNLAN